MRPYTCDTSHVTSLLIPQHLVDHTAIEAGPLVGKPEHLDPVEHVAIASAVDARRVAFASGRHYAKAALAQLGKPAAVIPRSDHRAPVWPEGYVGSIAHTREWAVAVVGTQDHVLGLGVDVENIDRVGADLVKRIATEAERHHASDPTLRAVIFSVKEAIYKAQHPILGLPLGFGDVTLTLDPDAKTAHTTVNTLRLDATWSIDDDSPDRVTSLVVASSL